MEEVKSQAILFCGIRYMIKNFIKKHSRIIKNRLKKLARPKYMEDK